jgi:outer membrane protein assembly factor BamB
MGQFNLSFFGIFLRRTPSHASTGSAHERSSRRSYWAASLATLAWAASVSASAAGWPQFRGLNGAGIADQERPPVEFGPGTNELFQVRVPPGASSPCIWGDRLFLTAFDHEQLKVLCLDRRQGKSFWERVVPAEKIEASHPTEGSPAASTPATDGERVYVYFGSCGLVCFDLDGQEVWHLSMPAAQHVGDFGTGTSPIVHDGVVVLNRDLLFGSHLLAVDARTGQVLWRRERPEAFSSYSTPVVWAHDGASEVVIAGALVMKAYDFKTGGDSWQVRGLPGAACTTPVLGDGLLYFAGWSPGQNEVPLPTFAEVLEKHDQNHDGALQKPEVTGDTMLNLLFTFLDANRDGTVTSEEWQIQTKTLTSGENALLAIQPGKGDITKSKVVWKQTRGLPYVPSPLFYRGLVYLVKDGGMVSCFDARTGQPHYLQERLGTTVGYYSSPVAADGKIFITSVTGQVSIIKAGEKPEVIGRCALDERCVTTPAIVGNTIYYRTATRMWAFAGKQPGPPSASRLD